MYWNFLLSKRILIVSAVVVFFCSSYSHAQGPKPRPRGKAHSSVTKHSKTSRKTSSGSTRSSPHGKDISPVPASVVDQAVQAVRTEEPIVARKRPKFKTKQEWLAEYAKHPEDLHKGTSLYIAFKNADGRVKKAELSNTPPDAVDKQMSEIYRANTKHFAPVRSAQEWLEIYKQHPEELRLGTPLYTACHNIKKRILRAERNNEPVDPLDQQMLDIYLAHTRRLTPGRTPQEWLDEYAAHPEELHQRTKMYTAFRHADARVKQAEEENRPVRELDRQMSEIYRAHTQRKAAIRTPQEWLDAYAAHPEDFYYGSPMYNAFSAIAVRRVRAADVNHLPVNELDRQIATIFWENTQRHAAEKPTEEVYDILLQYLRQNRLYPHGHSYTYRLIYSRLHQGRVPLLVRDLEANPALGRQYEQYPELNKLYQLDQLARAARRGEKPWSIFDREDPLSHAGVRRRTAAGPNDRPEMTPDELRRAYNEMPAEVQTTIRQVEEHYEAVWHEYPQWFEQNKPNIIFTPETKRAFEVLNREVVAGNWDENLVQIVADLAQISWGETNGVFYKLIYRGPVARGIKSEGFHIVAEEQGVELSSVKSIVTHKIPHIRLFAQGNRLTRMVLEKGVTVQDIAQVIEPVLNALGKGWNVRIDMCEMDLQPHIHFEWVDNENGMDMSYTLQLDVSAVIPEGPYAQREQGFKKLFGKYVE